MRKKQHFRSDTALRTAGVTLDHAAPVYDLLAPVMTLGRERHFRRLVISQLHLKGAEHVLDVGCGTGTLTRDIAGSLENKAESRSVGLDAAEKMIAVAKRKAAHIPNIRFTAAPAEHLPFPDNHFDMAASTFFFHHIHFHLKKKVLNEIARVLKPQGSLIVIDVDIPTTRLGTFCARSGYWLFQQEEIAENINGKLREAFNASPFDWHAVSHHSGYITLFKLKKKDYA